ncbi:MAG: HD domain-containing protein [Pyrinomonadaceae bacterium]
MSDYREAKYLSENDEPVHRIRCPIHGFIHFSKNERKIIDHPLFRRLRYVRQLALTEFIYPGASHTRFEHALGVMDVATRAFDSIASRNGRLLEETIKAVSGFEDQTMAKARQSLRLAALLHDVGHASFSHAAEGVVFKNSSHEKLSVLIIREADLLGKLIDQSFWDGCSAVVSLLIEGGRDLPPQLQVLKTLVSGEMDADRTDYLLRDSYHCGVEYGKFDHRRMLECLDVHQIDHAGGLEIALTRDGIHTFEALILGRYQMNTQVYYHRLRRIYDLYLIRYHEAISSEIPDDPGWILANNDITMMSRIFADAKDSDGEKALWARRISERNHHKMVFETGLNLNASGLSYFKELFQKVCSKFGGIEFLQDLSKATIHKILTPEDQEDTGLVHLCLKVSPTLYREIGDESQIFQKIPRRFQQARIFADLTDAKPELRHEIETFATTEWRNLGGN